MKKTNPTKIKDFIPLGILIICFGLATYPSIIKTYAPKWAPAEKVIEKETIVEKIVRQTPTVSVNTLRVIPTRIIDGDSLHCSIELPLSITLVDQRIRCLGYDAYELSELNGLSAKKELETLLDGAEVFGMTDKDQFDDFGRVLLHLYCRKGNQVIDIAKWMEEHKFTKPLKVKIEKDAPANP